MDFLSSSSPELDFSPSSRNPARSPAPSPSSKRKAGRTKFRETRHPVYHGVRQRSGGKWVCELRVPHKQTRIWLGTYLTPEMAARAHDVAAIALRGGSEKLNFPDSAWAFPRARSASHDDIRHAAGQAAAMSSPPPVTVVAESGVEAWFSCSCSSSPPAVFMDEDTLFNMPGLLDEMAVGMLLTPPGLTQGFDCNEVECHVDLSLWSE